MAPVPRHAAALSHLSLTPIVISKLPRATGRGFVKKQWTEQKIDETFNGSAWAKKRAQFTKRRQLNDFERFKVMKLRKQVRGNAAGLAHGCHPHSRVWQLELALQTCSRGTVG
jgi:large subunit ribosomal protein L14e